MSWHRGKCASCGNGAKHSNFRGRRAGYPVPDPCCVALRSRRPAEDDRLCQKCYEVHLASRAVPAASPATPPVQRQGSRSSSLDGSHWTTDSSERVAKLARRLDSGERVVPVALLEEKVEEMKLAERRATEARMAALYGLDEAQEECEVVQDYLLYITVAEDDKQKLMQRLVKWYREGSCKNRARLLLDL